MGALFDMPSRNTREDDKKIAKKVSTKSRPSAVSIRGSGETMLEKISMLNAIVRTKLGSYRDRYCVIQDELELKEYINDCIVNNIVSIDTETTGLDALLDRVTGFSIYTPDRKAAYIPLGHVSYITGVRVDNQLSLEFVAEQLQRLEKVRIIMFNAKFDMRVLKNQLGVSLNAYWDGYLAARLLNENEGDGNNNLKALHRKYCLGGEGDAISFGELFSGIPFTHIPIQTAYLYAARDAEITFELYKFQSAFLLPESAACREKDLLGVSKVFHEIEMPLVPVICEMEDRGICFDFKKARELSDRYREEMKQKEAAFFLFCAENKDVIEAYKRKNPSNKLGNPINIASPTQIAVLLYDILGLASKNKEKPRGTGEEILTEIDHPISKIILEYRTVAKLISTYIDKMQAIVNPNTGRIHCSFNQYGADTGRFSSSDPNMQNIPSHNKEIRQMFKAADGYVLLSSDYSAQEPRITAHMSKDEKMLAAYRVGKDLYAEVASIAFAVPYEECLEKGPDGKSNPKGKERRGRAKAIVLGVCYGKGVPAIAEDLGISIKLAQEIYDKILKEFPGLKQFMIDSEQMAKEKGFVTTIWGRKRRLPNIQLPPYEFSLDYKKVVQNFDPLSDDFEDETPDSVDPAVIGKYTRILDRCRGYKQRDAIIKKAREEGIIIKDNGGYIAEAVRQCVNSRIQGSAADQTKIAMILIGNDKRLKELDFHLLLTVHDELIGECPEANVKEVSERFSGLMVEAAKELSVPSKCDVEITKCWYGELYRAEEISI